MHPSEGIRGMSKRGRGCPGWVLAGRLKGASDATKILAVGCVCKGWRRPEARSEAVGERTKGAEVRTDGADTFQEAGEEEQREGGAGRATLGANEESGLGCIGACMVEGRVVCEKLLRWGRRLRNGDLGKNPPRLEDGIPRAAG